MKKSLLFLASLLMSASSFAQSFTATWTKPTVTNFVEMADDGETNLFLYNVKANGFLVGHNEYNTRASVSEYGDTIRMKALDGGYWNLQCYPAQYTNKNKWLYVSCNSWDALWVDGSANSANYPGTATWVVEKQDGGGYKLLNTYSWTEVDENTDTEVEKSFTGPLVVGTKVKGEEGNTRVFIYNPDATYSYDIEGETIEGATAFEGEVYDLWQFVAPDEYDAYTGKVAAYLAAENLKKQIEYAMNNGIAASELADQFAVYNNLESSASELKAAADVAYDKGRWVEIKEYFANITQGEKNDVSGVFVNNDFADGTINGWDITYQGNSTTATNIGYQYSSGTSNITIPETGEVVLGYINGDAWVSGFIEAWKDNNSPNYLGDGSITQTIPALPAGKYMLSVDAIVSNQNRVSDPSNPDHYPDDVQLFAKASLDGKEYYTDMYTKDGKPEHFEFTFIHTGGSMTLGLRVINSAEAKMPANWIAMDNLELFYYGEVTDDPEKVFLDAAIAKAEETYPAEEMDDLKAYSGDLETYTTALANAKNISENGGEYAEAQKTLEAAQATLAASIQAYDKLLALQDEAAERMEQFDGTKFAGISDDLSDMLGEWEEAYRDCSYTVEEIEGLTDKLSAAINNYVSENLEAGDDITFMIQNGNFDKDFSGWATTGARPAWGGINANPNGTMSDITMESGNAEVYHAQFTMSQTIFNMPAGLYQFTCQGFVRCDDGSKNEGALYATINGQEQSSSLPLITDYATEEQLFSDGTWWDDQLSGGSYVPNGMPGANYHFSHTIEGNEFPDYTATLNITLQESADVTVGVKCTNNSNWVIFDNFRLTYLGDGADAYQIAIDQKLAELNKYIESAQNDGKVIGNDAVKSAEDLEKGKKDLKTSEECIAFIAKIDEAIDYAKKSVDAYADADNTQMSLAMAIENSENAALAEEANAYMNANMEAISNADATLEEITVILAKMKGYITQLAMPVNYASATDENPVDVSNVIVNATFDEIGNFDGWSTGFGAGGTTSTNAECYEKTFDVYQDIVGLPAGTYEVSVQGYYRQGSSANDYTNTQTEEGTPAYNTVLYATGENGAESSAPIMSICADMLETALAGSTSVGDGAYWVPNTMAEATVWFDAVDDAGEPIGYYSSAKHPGFNAVIVKVGEDGKLRIGVKKDVTISADWAIFDNFKLTYFGADSSKEPTDIEGIDVAAPAKANGKYFENGRIVIVKNGVKYNVAGQAIK